MTILTETSIGNIFFFIFLAIFITLFVLLFIFKSILINDFNKTNFKDNKAKVSTFIYLLSIVQYLFLFYIGAIICMVLRFFVFHENDLKTKFPLADRSILDDTIMSKAGILPTCAVISLFLTFFIFLVNLLRFNVVETDVTLSQKVSSLLPLGPFAFLFGDEYKNFINDKYFNIPVTGVPTTETTT